MTYAPKAGSATARVFARALASFARIVRSAWSRTRSSPRTRSGRSDDSCLSLPNSRSTALRLRYRALNRFALTWDERVQTVGLEPNRLRAHTLRWGSATSLLAVCSRLPRTSTHRARSVAAEPRRAERSTGECRMRAMDHNHSIRRRDVAGPLAKIGLVPGDQKAADFQVRLHNEYYRAQL